MQANLIEEERVDAVFTPPPGQPPFDYVLDCSGEVRIGRNDDVSQYYLPLLDTSVFWALGFFAIGPSPWEVRYRI